MKPETKYLTEKEQIRLKLLEDEIHMLNIKASRILKHRDILQKEIKGIHELTSKTETK